MPRGLEDHMVSMPEQSNVSIGSCGTHPLPESLIVAWIDPIHHARTRVTAYQPEPRPSLGSSWARMEANQMRENETACFTPRGIKG